MSKTLPIEVLQDLIHNTHRTKGSRKPHLVGDCPYCGKERHFFISLLTNAWDCKKCGRNGHLALLLEHLGKSYLIAEEETVDISQGLKRLGAELQAEDTTVLVPNYRMPVGFKRVFQDEYLNSRKFQPKDYRNHPSGYTKLIRKYKDYVLVAVVQGGEIKGFMGRCTWTDSQLKAHPEKPKYLNSTNTDFASMLFNYDSITPETEVVIVVEGGFDAISTENELNLADSPEIKVVASFGKKISENQLKLLRNTNVKLLIFLYDAKDAIDEIKRYTFEAKQYFNVLVGIEMHGDPGSWRKEKFEEILGNLYLPEQIWTDKVNPKRLKV